MCTERVRRWRTSSAVTLTKYLSNAFSNAAPSVTLPKLDMWALSSSQRLLQNDSTH